jgi:trehalose 6-phosphate synthase
MSRLVIISNRVADLTKSAQSGGLAVGLADALRARGGVWFGWSGEIEETPDPQPVVEKIGNVETIGLPLSQKDYAEYYLGYSNSVLWPLFHYRLDLVDYRPGFFKGYARVNRAFARALAAFLKPDDVIWVHDYHLILVAEHLRKLGVRNRIGFFLHIPFPPPDLLAASPSHKALVDGLFQYDLLGFQTHTDVGNLKRFAEEHAVVEVIDDTTFKVGERTVVARRFPIGIDVDVFRGMAKEMPEDVRIDAARRKSLERKQIIGVDRLDYSKGLPDRMKAFGRLLSQHPELDKRVTFLQIAPPTREEVDAYSDIRTELEVLTGSINGHFSDFNWTPIRYIHRSVPRDKLAALFRASPVGFVTPLRDGMNLVAKEYVAAQDPDDPGVLVLSQFAGAAEEMQDALIVNPYDIDEMARKLYEALTMPLAERRRRHAALYETIERYDAKAWLADFLDTLETTSEGGASDRASAA